MVLERPGVGAPGVGGRVLCGGVAMTRQTISIAAMFVILAGTASAQTLDVLKVTYVRTVTDATTGSTKVTEEGAYQIAPDGVYRIDRLDKVTGARTATIENFRTNQRTTLDVDRREAHIGSTTGPVQPGGHSAWRPMGKPQSTDLGTKQAAGLTLNGQRFTHVFAGARGQIVHNNEVWFYRHADPKLVPVILEMRYDTPSGIEEQKIIGVEHIQASGELFRVPRTFTTK
jgi:hypothetical protein